MSSLLVDTHALLWFLEDDPRLSAVAKEAMESPANVLLVSSASIWEIVIKQAGGKLRAPADLPGVLTSPGFHFLAIRPQHAWRVGDLPHGEHKDPFDQMLAAQALLEGLPLISKDRVFDEYGVERIW